MMLFSRPRRCLSAFARGIRVVILIPTVSGIASTQGNIHTSYLWHLHQPIYWNDQRESGEDRYELAWDSIQAKDGGRPHPENNLREIFGKDDRVAAYQFRPRDSLTNLLGYPDAGVQVNYSGALFENVGQLAFSGQLGYFGGWETTFQQARGWSTSGGKPRMDIVLAVFHHPIAPLVSPETLEMEIRLYQEAYARAWGSSPDMSRGFFPPELCFSERMIPVLNERGIDWVVIANDHISRACSDFPAVLGTGGVNCDPPNRADQVNPPQGDYVRRTVSRGCSPANAAPFAYRPHYAEYVDPETGTAERIIVVPADAAWSWIDGYQCFDAAELSVLEGVADPSHPPLVLFAHDGDNAFGGGYSYYMECVPQFASAASSRGYVLSTVEEYLADFPLNPEDVVHVEDGGWINADGDFGSPIFINWNYPLLDASGNIDIANGWHEKERDQATFVATENRVRTAQQIAGESPRMSKILEPDSTTTHVERAWHYYLGSLDSGNVYYGPALDNEVKATIGCNEAVEHADVVIGDGNGDLTGPTIWIPQRHPYNPGSLNFGVQYHYSPYLSNGDFWIWTFIADVSDVSEAILWVRTDHDGTNPIGSHDNETYTGGPEVGEWQGRPMNRRPFPKENVYGNPEIDFFEIPTHIADVYWVRVTGLRNTLIDYYVEAIDSKGNVSRSAIQHVFIGAGYGPTSTATPHGTPQPTPTPGPGFVMDGLLDPQAELVASNGMSLYVAVEGTTLYVATQDAGEGSDHFIFVTDHPVSPVAAPWAKAGTVASDGPFLADENDNDFVAWFQVDAGVSTQAATRPTSQNDGVLEGTIDLAGQFGSLPSRIYLAVGVYETYDGGSLLPAYQVPASQDGDGDIDVGEYYVYVISTRAEALWRLY